MQEFLKPLQVLLTNLQQILISKINPLSDNIHLNNIYAQKTINKLIGNSLTNLQQILIFISFLAT